MSGASNKKIALWSEVAAVGRLGAWRHGGDQLLRRVNVYNVVFR